MDKYENLKIDNIRGGKSSFCIEWSCEGIGYGQLTFLQNEKGILMDTEAMGEEFVKKVLEKLLEKANNYLK